MKRSFDLIEFTTGSQRYIGVLARSINDAVYVSVLDQGGDLVEDFSANGTAVMPGAGSYDADTLVFVDDGLIVVGNTTSGCGFAARFGLDGDLDATFDTDGIAHIPCVDYSSEHPTLAGATFGAFVDSGNIWAISYRNFDGHPDTAHHQDFTMVMATPINPGTGATGTEHDLYETPDFAPGRIAFHASSNRLVIASDGDTPFTPGGWLVAHVDTTTWTRDTSFGTGGLMSLYPDIGDSNVLDVVWQDTDLSTYLLVEDTAGDRSVIRVNSFGSFVSGYGTSGHATVGDEPFRPSALAAGSNRGDIRRIHLGCRPLHRHRHSVRRLRHRLYRTRLRPRRHRPVPNMSRHRAGARRVRCHHLRRVRLTHHIPSEPRRRVLATHALHRDRHARPAYPWHLGEELQGAELERLGSHEATLLDGDTWAWLDPEASREHPAAPFTMRAGATRT